MTPLGAWLYDANVGVEIGVHVMGEELPVARRANILAEGLGIAPATYSGMESEALDAMTVLQKYRLMQPWDREAVLPAIQKVFGDTHPAFVSAARVTLAMQIANPAWIPASMTNDEIFADAVSWERVEKLATLLGGGALSDLARNRIRSAGSAAMSAQPGQFWSTLFTKLGRTSPPAIFTAGLLSVSKQSHGYWRSEMKRRLQSGEMKPEDVRRNYGDLH